MMQAFEMTDLREMAFFQGLEIQQLQQGIFIGQQKYAREVLKKFNMEDCKSLCTLLAQNEKFSKDGAKKVDEGLYRNIIGCLMYLTTRRPDIMFPVNLLSRYMHCASGLHYKAAKRVLRYVKGTLDLGIKFEKKDKLVLHGFVDSSWAGSCDDMRSTSGYLFSLGSGCFCWSSKKQEIIAQSTAEAEYVSVAAAVNQALWLRKLMTDLKMVQDVATRTSVDN
ncbi:Retrovirus-related Pol polyprotein from transposon RE2 [Vitis vinifera]|uniref:Retrovirus-related Pol polyprotein from transposon RE2 n=1 Tax=Vitis vinifera TaxID=29760 RepID=A0A438E1N3_VITVI|nr:Retrovirus-related Pol polyprotein from transposon RE2 [Vitis vinifera]